MQRIVGWERNLKLVIERHSVLPSQYGISDCYLFPSDAVHAVTGEWMYPDISYSTEQGAGKLLLQRGFKTVEDAFGAKFETVHPAMAQRGDIGVIESNDLICGGVFTSTGFMARDPEKLTIYPISRIKTAFKVGR